MNTFLYVVFKKNVPDLNKGLRKAMNKVWKRKHRWKNGLKAIKMTEFQRNKDEQ